MFQLIHILLTITKMLCYLHSFPAFAILLKKYKTFLTITKYCFHHTLQKIMIQKQAQKSTKSNNVPFLTTPKNVNKERKTLNQLTKNINTYKWI